jgi:two-component system OmpR family sensor kinase
MPSTGPVDVAKLATRAVEALAPLAGPDRITVNAPTKCIVEAEENDLYEAIKNVVENAVRYAPKSPLALEVSCDRAAVSIVVSDRGPGMDARDVEHAFDRFYRGGERSGEGSGLGLAIAKRAVERIGGTIALESTPGAGTRVTISLPAGSTSA